MKSHLLSALFTILLTAAAPASVVITYAEAPKDFNSTLTGTQIFDFNHLANGVNKNVVWAGVGTFDRLYIKSADVYGGAADALNPGGTKYSLQGAGVVVNQSTLTFDTASAYFGMWWSAGDAQNVLTFYLGDSIVSKFTTGSLLSLLPDEYDGNPRNKTLNAGEPYAFINFFGDASTSWDRVVLSNTAGSGFESDNYTSRVAAWDPLTDGALPGVVVAEVSGTTTKQMTNESLAGTRWALGATSAASVPGAPVPPWTLLLAFACVTVLRARKGRKE